MYETPHTDEIHVDEAMVRLEQAIERSEARFPSAEERRAFDSAVREMLIDLGQRQGEEES